MPSPLQVILESIGARIDEDLLPSLYEAASAPSAEIRAWLREEGIPHLDPESSRTDTLEEVEAAARRLVGRAQGRAAAMGVAGGMAGALAIPPEVVATLVHHLRLAQRLAVMFGFDPEDNRGRLVLWRALAAAYEVALPEQMSLGVKVRDLPAAFRSQVPATRQAGVWVAQQLFWRTLGSIAGRVTRIVPGLGAGVAGLSGYRRTAKLGERMIAVYRRAADATPFDLTAEVDAIEILG
jgi:hypothetical protein